MPKEDRGGIDSGTGIQALVIRIGGSSDRPDGSTFYITWSLDKTRGRHAAGSNGVVRRLGW